MMLSRWIKQSNIQPTESGAKCTSINEDDGDAYFDNIRQKDK